MARSKALANTFIRRIVRDTKGNTRMEKNKGMAPCIGQMGTKRLVNG